VYRGSGGKRQIEGERERERGEGARQVCMSERKRREGREREKWCKKTKEKICERKDLKISDGKFPNHISVCRGNRLESGNCSENTRKCMVVMY